MKHVHVLRQIEKGARIMKTEYNFVFHGKSAHAASAPEDGRGAFDALQMMIRGLLFYRQETEASIEYHIASWGNKPANVIPDHSELKVEIDARDEVDFENVCARVVNIAKGSAKMTQTTVEF